MAKVSTIINQLIAVLPILTDKFSDTVPVTEITRSGSTATVTTTVDHGLAVSDLVHISGALSPLAIDTLTRVDDIVTGVTFEKHDLTQGFQETIEIQGADQTQYNGTFDLLSVPNRKTFTYRITTTPVSPATGSILVFDGKDRGYNGVFLVASAPTTTTFTYTLVGTPISPAHGTILAKKNFRISGGVELERIMQSYSKQPFTDDLWLFVIPGRTSTTKNRQFDNDTTYSPVAGIEYRQQMFEQYSLYVFFPTKDEIAARGARDEAQDIRRLLFKSILGVNFVFEVNETDVYLMSFVEDGIAVYTGPYYVHQYLFEITAYINGFDIVEPQLSVAFRQVELSIKQDTPDGLSPELTAVVDLDSEPL